MSDFETEEIKIEPSEIKIEKIVNEDEKPYKCNFCFKAYKLNCSLIFHERTHQKNKEIKIELCEITDENLPESTNFIPFVKDPLQLEDGEEAESESENDKSNSEEQLVLPLTDDDKKSLECPICKKKFKILRYLESHYKEIHEMTNELLNCRFCIKTFKRKGQLTNHELNHLDEKSYKCSCSRGFNTLHQLSRHEKKSNHKNNRKVAEQTNIECKICKQICKTRIILKYHIKEVHDKIKKFKCSVEGCDAAFTRKQHLQSHITYLHSDERLFKCCECDKSFKQKRDLNVHNLTHTGVKNFKCNICGKTFSVEGTLKLHLETHSDKCKCSFSGCDKEFSSKYSLKNHENYQHKGAKKNHICDICEKDFRNSGELKTHKFTHFDVRTFKCQLCPKSYKHNASLLCHEKIHFRRVKVKDVKGDFLKQ